MPTDLGSEQRGSEQRGSEESAGAERSGVRVHTTESGPVLRTLEIEVDKKRVGRAFDRAYRDLAKRTRVRGFRPGKAPRAVLEKLYGAAIAEEIERALVAETLPEAVEESGLRPVSEPSIDAKPPVADLDFSYVAQIEVKPEIELPKLRGLPGQRPNTELSEADVLLELENVRERNAAVVEEDEGTPAAEGHIVKIDFVGRIDGEPFEGGTGNGVDVEVGGDRFVPGFADQLVGVCSGSDCEIEITFPADYGNPELAGKAASFATHVVAVQRRELPDLDDEFAKDLGEFESLAELRNHIRAELQANRQRVAESTVRRTVLDSLVERTHFEVPPGLIERRLQRMLAGAHRQLHGSVAEDELHGQLTRWQEEWRPRAEREVREALLLEAVAQQEKIEVEDGEIDARIETLAKEESLSPAQLRRTYEDNELIAALRVQIQDEKALDFLCREAKIEETS